ncbi:unnamed protein product [Boreogadus saida]
MDVFQKNVGRLRERADVIAQESGAEGNKRRKTTNTAAVLKEACDTTISQVQDRFAKSDHLIAAKLIDCTLFPKFVQAFPEAELDCAFKLWPINNKVKLKTELKSLYLHITGQRNNNFDEYAEETKCALINEMLDTEDRESGASASAADQPESLAQTAVPPPTKIRTLGDLLKSRTSTSATVPKRARADLELTRYLQEEPIDSNDNPLAWVPHTVCPTQCVRLMVVVRPRAAE